MVVIAPKPAAVDLVALRSRKQVTLRWVRHGAVGFLAAFLIVYLVIPKLITAHRNIHRLEHLNVAWVVVGTAACIVIIALLIRLGWRRGKHMEDR